MRLGLDVSAVPANVAGAGRYVVELARRLPAREVDVTLVTRRSDLERWRRWSPDARWAPVVPDRRVARLAYEAWRVGVGQSTHGLDVWHSPHYTMPRRRALPTVVTIHDLTFFTNPEWHERSKVVFFRRAITYAAAHADALICVSEFTAHQLDEALPTHAPVVVAPHGVNLDTFTPRAEHDDEVIRGLDLDASQPYLFFLGTFEPRKGLDVLLDAFETLARANPDLELWLAGQIGWGLAALESQLATHPAAHRIRRLGFVDEAALPALLRRARCVVYPSRAEGFGLPVLEAMACGALVVTSSDTVMAEVSGDCCELAAPGDSTALAAAVQTQLERSDAQRAAWGVRARSRAEAFTWEASMTMHLNAYDLARRAR